jgi:steroid delta-isomerase-like uncharacterized protein
MLSLFTDDCVYEDMAMGAINRGKAQLRKFAEEVLQTMPDFHVTFINPFATDEWGAASWEIKATWNGLFEGVDCTGQGIEFAGLSMYRFRDGRFCLARDCWDYTAMIRNFGVLPPDLRSLRS